MRFRKHPGYQHSYRAGFCVMCGDPESLTFAGMATAVSEQAEAAAIQQAAELTEQMRKPLGDVSRKAGAIENDSPLFYGKVNPTLF